MTDTPITIQLSGNVTIIAANGAPTAAGGRQPQVLLAMLALEGGQVAAEAVANVLWGDDLSTHWRGALRGIVSKLRATLATATGSDEAITFTHGIAELHIPFTTNVARAEALTSTAVTEALSVGTIDELCTLAASLTHPFLIHNDSVWADSQRRHIEVVLDRAERAVLESLQAHGMISRAITWAQGVITRNPVDIITREALVELHLEAGDLVAAHREFTDLEVMLAAEFDTAPDATLAERVRATRSQRLDLASVAPISHHPDAGAPFVGRRDALESIRAAWQRVQDSSTPELVVVRGPAGVGKTRLADEALDALGPPQQLWGRSRPGLGHSWGPFADALADVFIRNPRLAHSASVGFPTIGRLLPELETKTKNGSSPQALGEATPRDSAIAVTREITADLLDTPTMFVIDDLQWAGLDGLALIESILVDNHGPLLVIATCREITDSLATVLESLARRITVTDIQLESFDLDELTELRRLHAPKRPFTSGEIENILRRTGGLPFYACALLRDGWVEDSSSGIAPAPESVTVWLSSFLKTLQTEQRQLLELISVFGNDADLAAIEAVSPNETMEVADTLDELATAGMIVIDAFGRVKIPHDLTLLTVWESIGPARRASLHRMVGDHLATIGVPASTLARQWTFAGPSRRTEALDARLHAGANALDQGAWSSALEQFEAVHDQANDPAMQIAALTGSGRALVQLREHAKARTALERAADLAAHHGFDHELAEATLLLVGRAGRGAITDDESAQLQRLRTAWARLRHRQDLDTDARTRVLLSRIEIELAIALMFTGSSAERTELATAALQRIRATPDATPDDLATILLGQRSSRMTPADIDAQIAEFDEVLTLPHGQLDPDSLIAAYLYRHEDLLRTGRRREGAVDLSAARTVAQHAHHAYWLWAVDTWEALGDLMDGDVAGTEARFATAAASRADVAEAFACQQVNLVGLRLLQDRVDEMIPTLQVASDMYPEIPTWRAALALALVESGNLDPAAEHLDAFVASSFAILPDDTNRLFALGILAHVAATVASSEAARLLWPLLDPYRGQLVLLNVYGGGGACWGPMEWALARLAPLVGYDAAETTGLWDLAVTHARAVPVLSSRITDEAAAARSQTHATGNRNPRRGRTAQD